MNKINAVDTKVDNAISGGSLIAPFTFDVKNSAYTDTLNNSGLVSSQWNSLTVNLMKVGGGGDVNCPFPVICTRTYSMVFDLKSNYKLKVDLSTTTDYGTSTGYTLILLLDTAGSILYQRQVDLGTSINEAIPLSSFSGNKVRVAFSVAKTGSRQTSFVINANIGSIIITNES